MLLDDVATYIDTNSTALSVGATGNLLKAQLLDSIPADTCVALYEQSGTVTSQSFSTGSTGAAVEFENPNLQVISRSTSYTTARTNAQTIFTLLDGLSATLPTATGTNYLSIDALQSPFSIGKDRNERWLVSVNFAIRKVIG